jgi:hypothetical protein
LDIVVFVNFGKNSNILKQVTDLINNDIQCVHDMRDSIKDALYEHDAVEDLDRKDFNMLHFVMNGIEIDLLIVPSDPQFHNPQLILNYLRTAKLHI